MLKTYRSVFEVPGSAGFSSAGFVARLPISMLGIVIVLLVATTSGGYGLAGAVSAAFSLSGAVFSHRFPGSPTATGSCAPPHRRS